MSALSDLGSEMYEYGYRAFVRALDSQSDEDLHRSSMYGGMAKDLHRMERDARVEAEPGMGAPGERR